MQKIQQFFALRVWLEMPFWWFKNYGWPIWLGKIMRYFHFIQPSLIGDWKQQKTLCKSPREKCFIMNHFCRCWLMLNLKWGFLRFASSTKTSQWIQLLQCRELLERSGRGELWANLSFIDSLNVESVWWINCHLSQIKLSLFH